MDAVKPAAVPRRYLDLIPPVASGVLLSLAFPPLGWWWIAWIALVPLLSSRATGIRAARDGFLFGLTLFLVGMFWMNEIGTGPWIVLSCIQAIPFALLIGVASWLVPRVPVPARPWVFAALWTVFEGVRSAGAYAFPWFFLAPTQVRMLPMLQVVSITGQWGLTFAVAAVNALVGESWASRSHRPLIPAAVVLLGLGIGGTIAVVRGNDNGPTRRIAAVQGSVTKQSGYSDAARAGVLAAYLDLTRSAATEKPMLIVWPETVVPGYLIRDGFLLETVKALARESGTSLLVGSADIDEKNRLYNTGFLLAPDGSLADRYDKTQPVPLGEFFPLRSILSGFYTAYGAPRQDMAVGTRSGVMRLPGGETVGALICYESAFPRIARERTRGGAQVLALLTSDQTFGATAGPYQHADLSALRAVENRRYVLRAASTGVSEVIDPWGRVRDKLGINVQGVLPGDVRLRDDITPFVRFGDWFLWLCVAVVFGAAIRARSASDRV